MFLKFSKYIINHSLLILFFMGVVTTFLFYQAFVSDNKLQVDFSLEQMFPVKDADRDYYENFKEIYGREDNVVFLSLTNNDIFSNNNLSILEMVTDNLRIGIENIDFSFSLGNLWYDGDGDIGEHLNRQEKSDKIMSSDVYSNLVSKDQNSTLIMIKIKEDVNTHIQRTSILNSVDSIKNAFKFDLVYNGDDFLIKDSYLSEFYNSFNLNLPSCNNSSYVEIVSLHSCF